jgi:hypothetical protein
MLKVTCRYTPYMCKTTIASMSFSEGRSFLISRRIGFGRAFLPFKKTRPIAYRTKVLGRALLAVRTDANSFWMLLSGNAEVAFPSTTATIAAAANLPTDEPATATAASSSTSTRTSTTATTSTTHVVAVAASVMPALTTAATISLPTAAAAVAASATTLSTIFASDSAPAATTSTAAVATHSASKKRNAHVLNPSRD